MAHSILVVGVGGGGKGICNHIKYESERVFGSLKNANTFLLNLDGVGHDQDYLLPNNFEIDTLENSKEYFPYINSADPTPVLKKLVNGDSKLPIAHWLTPDAANQVLKSGTISPSSGFSGQRVPGHAYMYVDHSRIYIRIKEKIQELERNAPDEQDKKIIFLVGTQVGGTGAGTLLDVATMLSHLIQGKQNTWLINLYPLSDTYAKLSADTLLRSAKGFSGFLDLLSINSMTTEEFPFLSEYSESHEYQLKLGKFIHIPFVVDGNGANYQYNNVPPQKGVIPVMSDFIFSLVRDLNGKAATHQHFTNYNGKINDQPRNCMFATFGNFSIQYPWQELANTFKYRFANAFYQKVFENEEYAKIKGINLANELASLNRFFNRIVNLNFSLWDDKNITNILTLLTVGNTNDRRKPSLDTLMKVSMTNFGMFSRNATEFRNEVQAVQNAYLKEVKTFLEDQRKLITASFKSGITNTIKTIFYTNDDQGGLKPRDLNTHPSSIIEFVAFLETFKLIVKKYGEKIENDYKTIKPAADKYQLAAGKLMGTLEDVGKKKEMADFLEGVVRYTKVESWRLTVEVLKQISINLNQYISVFYERVGETANGWLGIFKTYMKETESLWITECNYRKERGTWKGRKYLPEPDGYAEDQLFEELIIKNGKGLLSDMMSKMNWNICVDPNGSFNSNQLNDPSSTTILLTIPIHKVNIPEIYKNVITDDWINVTSGYSFYDHIIYAEMFIPRMLENMNIWEIMEIDFKYGYMKSNIDDAKKNMNTYLNELRDEMINGANVGLSATAVQVSNPQRFIDYSYYFAPLSLVKNNNQNDFGVGYNKNIPAKINVDTSDSNSHEIRLVNTVFGVDPTETNSFKEGQSNYFIYLNNPDYSPLNIYQNQQNAEKLRRIVVANIDSKYQRVFIPEVIALLNDYVPTYANGERPELTNAFENFSLCYLSEMLFEEELLYNPSITSIPQIRLKIIRENNVEYQLLGEIWNLPLICKNVVKYKIDVNGSWLDNPARGKIVEIWNEKVEKLRKDNLLKQYLIDLRDKSIKGEVEIKMGFNPDGKKPQFPVDDLLLAMRASCIGYINNVLRTLK